MHSVLHVWFGRKRGESRAWSWVAVSALSGLIAGACVGQSESRRGGPSAAYTGPMITWESETPPRLTGRFVRSDDGVTMAWSGSAATVRFHGTAVSAELTDTGDNRYLVIVDGKPKRDRIAPIAGRSTVSLVKGLPRSEHTVTLYRLTEPLLGETTLHGFILDSYAEPLPPPLASERRLLVLGDSISTGYGNEGEGPDCEFSSETQNHFLSYGARAARELEAELTTVAWSGKGVFTNRGNDEDPETMPVLWTRTLPERDDSEFNFDGPKPDAVLINLGTNDFAPEVDDVGPFRPAYEKLLRDVRQRYPEAHLIVAVGPLLSDDWPPGKEALTTVRTTLRALVARRAEAGDERVHYLEFEPVRPEEGWGCQSHPTVATHMRMAAQLTGFLRKTVGW